MRVFRPARAATATRILNRAVRPALQRQMLTWERRPLDADAMHRAAQSLLGENDFSRLPHRAVPGAACAP